MTLPYKKEKTILEEWDIDEHFFTNVVRDNPSLRGMILGYIAERKLEELFTLSEKTNNRRKDDDHDRSKKGDLTLEYKGEEITIEVKSLQTNSILIQNPKGEWIPMIKKVEVARRPSPGFKKDGTPKLGAKIYKYISNSKYQILADDYRKKANYRGAFQCDASYLEKSF